MSEHTQPASVERESAEVLGREEGGDGLLPPGQHLHRHRLLPHAGHGQAVAVDVQQGPEREVDGESSQVAADVMVVDKQPEVSARTQAERQPGPVLGQALLVRLVTTQQTNKQTNKVFVCYRDIFCHGFPAIY